MSKSNLIAILFFSSFALQAREYVVPPTSSAGSAGVISDEAMEQCVILYNEANWLSEELDVTPVDNYSQASINSYNSKVQLFNDMQNRFNANCAGKQSRSAYEAARKLNQQQ